MVLIYQLAYLLDFDHTTVVSKALSFLSLSLNIENSQGGCVLPLSPFDKMIAPYVVALGMIVCQGLWHAMIQFVRGPDRGPLFKKIWAKTIHWFPYLDTGLRHSLKRTSIILIFFYFSPVYSTAVGILSCRTIEGLPSVVWDYPSIQCWTGSHTAVAIVSGAIVVVQAIVLPGALLRYGLHRQNDATDQGKTVQEDRPERERQSRTHVELEKTDPFYVLHSCYTDQFRWWMAVDLMERSMIIGLPMLLRPVGAYVPIYVTLSTLWMFLMLRALMAPYRSSIDHAVRILGYSALIVEFSFQLRQKYITNQYGVTEGDAWIEQMVAVVVPAAILIPVKLFSKVPVERRQHLTEQLLYISQKSLRVLPKSPSSN
ncbi:uncharacterized protein BJ171DRAFT_248796 [Polychytrium aggregatum]|uniref:uncharacterized protein n=1 Tax=Polychytrium aggregatum TaxID=110093 RepID=UPI0022FE9B49|nr:uncharacterized protein BJ171DRAFT_248796 [Polychytrium aggregatum]KAI9193724.1 hypothetical protein BJ171DRAFT_248796 [Polychytrium aggregatum]